MTSPKFLGRVSGVVFLLDLSMVAMFPRSMMSGASEVDKEKVFLVNE